VELFVFRPEVLWVDVCKVENEKVIDKVIDIFDKIDNVGFDNKRVVVICWEKTILSCIGFF